MHYRNKKIAGFTLVGLAITLVMIGLIVGGIMVSSSIMQAAKLQTVVADIEVYRKAFSDFRDKYYALPGDMPDATNFWATDALCPNSTYTTTTHTATCNGDGNGQISSYEMFRAWQQLSNAYMIPGAYVGMSGAAGFDVSKIGINVPASQMSPAGYTLYYNAPVDATGTTYFPGNYGHIIMFGIEASNTQTSGPILTTANALSIDQKVDDGYPAFGKVITSTSVLASNSNCTTSDVATNSAYKTSYTSGTACNMIFLMGF